MADIHLPYEDKQTLAGVKAMLKDNKFDKIILGGDILDLNEISRFNEDKPRLKTEKLMESFASGNAFLDELQALTRGSEIIYLEGNHEYRVEAYMDKNEELSGLLEIEKNLKLKERKIQLVRSHSKGEMYRIGNASFMHGLYVNSNHAKKTAQTHKYDTFYGHTHDVMEFPVVLKGDDDTRVAKSLGCLCSYDQTYLKGNPTNWQQGFGIFHFFPDGAYQEQTIKIYKHRFFYNGKVYGK